MSKTLFAGIALGLLLVAVVLNFLRISQVSTTAERETESLKTAVMRLEDSLRTVMASLDSLPSQTPGLGEYMSTIQLHAAKLWFAGQASNWELAKYEVDELGETTEAAEALHVRKNNVDISSVLQSVRQTQLPLLEKSIRQRKLRAFNGAYEQTLAACNGCHRSAGYGFIHIITPSREPVTNQRWKAGVP